MGLFDFLRAKPKGSANIARDRLMIAVVQERASRNAPDYLPLLRKELLEVIRKYVNVNADAVTVNVQNDGQHELLELSVTLPEKG
jgi:cell division topological specificity factor